MYIYDDLSDQFEPIAVTIKDFLLTLYTEFYTERIFEVYIMCWVDLEGLPTFPLCPNLFLCFLLCLLSKYVPKDPQRSPKTRRRVYTQGNIFQIFRNFPEKLPAYILSWQLKSANNEKKIFSKHRLYSESSYIYTHRNIFEILRSQIEIRLYLP